MVDHIELGKKTYRDLMVITVTKLNDIADKMEDGAKIQRDHTQRLSNIEGRCHAIHGDNPTAAKTKTRYYMERGGVFGIIIAAYEGIRYLVEFLLARPPP